MGVSLTKVNQLFLKLNLRKDSFSLTPAHPLAVSLGDMSVGQLVCWRAGGILVTFAKITRLQQLLKMPFPCKPKASFYCLKGSQCSYLQVTLSCRFEGCITFHPNTWLCMDSVCPQFQCCTFLGIHFCVQIPPLLVFVLMPREAESIVTARAFPQVSGELF